MARITSLLLFLLATLNLSTALSFRSRGVPKTDYDVIIVGGGPAGLSALSALCRVKRRAVLFDTLEYRNNKTRNMHDVIGNDGTPPSVFRLGARKQIDKYQLATFIERRISDIKYRDEGVHRVFTAYDEQGKAYTARRVVMGTGVSDVLPDTPGVWDAYGKGMYWCPWCDGFEHRDQSLAVMGPLSDALSSVVEMHNINPDTMVLTNGTDTEKERDKAKGRSATYREQLAAYHVPVINNTIVRIQRLRDGAKPCPRWNIDELESQQQIINGPSDDAGPNGKHCDLFRIHFEGGLSLVREAILMNIPVRQTSHLPAKLGLDMDYENNKVKVDAKTKTSIDGLYAIGDCNNEGSTNVPHAMYNGKKVGVVVHVALAKEESMASIAKRSLFSFDELHMETITMGDIGNSLEDLWDSIKAQFDS